MSGIGSVMDERLITNPINTDRIDEAFFERYCELASQKTKARGRVGQQYV
jgi:hypothetical protein